MNLPFSKRKELSEEEIENLPGRHQVTVFGFACDHTAAFMPLPIWLAHKLARKMIQAKRRQIIPYLSPDAATQVGVEFRNRRPSPNPQYYCHWPPKSAGRSAGCKAGGRYPGRRYQPRLC